eukprot:99682-Rhodomonas_salina.5
MARLMCGTELAYAGVVPVGEVVHLTSLCSEIRLHTAAIRELSTAHRGHTRAQYRAANKAIR